MRKVIFVLAFALVFLPHDPSFAASPPDAFAKLKTLAGEWHEAGDATKKPIVTYTVRSDGTSLVEEFDDMISVYHEDGSGILMTHYCSGNNQPRLRATDFSGDLGELRFDFVDVTFGKPGSHYVNGLRIRWIDQDRIEQSWYSSSTDEKTKEFKILLERVR